MKFKKDIALNEIVSQVLSDYDDFYKFELKSDIEVDVTNPTVSVYLAAPSEIIKLDDLFFCVFKK